MGRLILLIYTIIDIETAINVWSDVCVIQMINKECKGEIQK